MANDNGMFSCRNTSLIVGGLLGLVALLLVWRAGAIIAILVGIVVAIVVAFVLIRLFCTGSAAGSGVAGAAATARETSTETKPTPSARPAPSPKSGDAPSEMAADAANSAAMGNPDAAAVSAAPAMNAASMDSETKKHRVAKKKAPGKTTKPATDDTEGAARSADTKAADAAGPELLDKPRAGGADDLKMIKGVGPGIEKKLHDAGVYHFDQIAGWSAADIAVMDEKLSFRGRIGRDDWVGQARILAKGGETEFSNKAASSSLYETNKKK